MATGTLTAPAVRIRRATPSDAPACGRICYEAFAAINAAHGYPPDFPNPDVAIGLLAWAFSHERFHCVVAETDDGILGSNCLDERSVIAGIGPITVEPRAQNGRVGRMLMEAVLQRVEERAFPGVRLVQGAFHNRSLSLYAKLGFEAREPLSVMQGPAIRQTVEGCAVRKAVESDIQAASRLCERVHGHNRVGELRDAIAQGSARIVEREGRVTGYASALAFFGHAVAETDLDLQALIAAADEFAGPGILVPTRNAALFRWCLDRGLRVVFPATLMTIGLYNEPRGAYLPSILY